MRLWGFCTSSEKKAEIACLGRAARPEASARPKHPSSDFGITSSFQAALVALF